MAYFELNSFENAVIGGAQVSGEVFLQLGLMYSTGRNIPIDRVAAHKWFNLAAAKGSLQAAGLRRELAMEMHPAEIAEAQHAARTFMAAH